MVPETKEYRLFISHAWHRSEDYDRLVGMLDRAYDLEWRNYSVPEEKAKDAEDTEALTAALRQQMQPTQCILVVSGMYAAYSDWIQQEIELAAGWGKPIIGITPRGNVMMPQAVSSVADIVVGWDTPAIVRAIKHLVP